MATTLAYASDERAMSGLAANYGFRQPGSPQRPVVAAPQLIIPPHQISADTKPPSTSSVANTFRGVWGGSVVAVKKLPAECPRPALIEHVRRSQSIRNPHLLQILGASPLDADPPYIVTPYLMNGTIMEYLSNHPTVARIKAVYQIALGMSHLHSLKVIHGRLKPTNILINDHGHVCITDYGLYQLNNIPASSPRYYSPEAWKGAVSKPSDVYAFAMTSYEILAMTKPWGFLSDTQIYQLVVRENERPDRPYLEAPHEIISRDWELLEAAWHSDPNARPTFSEIVTRLSEPLPTEPAPSPNRGQREESEAQPRASDASGVGVTLEDNHLVFPAPPPYPLSRSPSGRTNVTPPGSRVPSVSASPPSSRDRSISVASESHRSQRSQYTPHNSPPQTANIFHTVLSPPRQPLQIDSEAASRSTLFSTPHVSSLRARPSTAAMSVPPSRRIPLVPQWSRGAMSVTDTERTSSLFDGTTYESELFSPPPTASQLTPDSMDTFRRQTDEHPYRAGSPTPSSVMLPAPNAGRDRQGSVGSASLHPRWMGYASQLGTLPTLAQGSESLSVRSGSKATSITPNKPSAVLLVGALQAEINEGRKQDVIDHYLHSIEQLIVESEKEAEKLITAGIIPTLIHLLKSRAVDGIGLDMILKLLGHLSYDPLSANIIFRTNTTTTLLEIVNTSGHDDTITLGIWCLSRTSRSAELAVELIKSNIVPSLLGRGLTGATLTVQAASWCLGNLIHNDTLADMLSVFPDVAQSIIDNLKRTLEVPLPHPDTICAAIYPIARMSRSVKLAKTLAKLGCIEPLVRCLTTFDHPDILDSSARAIGCLMRPNSADLSKLLLDAGAAGGLARLPRVIPTEAVHPLESFAFAIQRFSAAEWGAGTRKALVEAGVVDSLLAALRTAADIPYPKAHIQLALAIAALSDVGGSGLRKEIVRAGGIDILKRVGEQGNKDVAKACGMAITTVTGNIWTRNTTSAKVALMHDWSGGCPHQQPSCPVIDI
ncbi:hypothetical protein BOTBODRAFT_33247 [Botryobasidium botryosum FD-172 SS1]|uniref:Protein kinase domain-containing protein n=1 Tax=Botryobasidium botryosum (strain FD-172 SS1) TaxID=930990 RepID=A0A067ME49_BOTB1|nr:hypothetical protein BOTBODRAFT_33247 [Botryobasidium botryosum FD-172 SS1]